MKYYIEKAQIISSFLLKKDCTIKKEKYYLRLPIIFNEQNNRYFNKTFMYNFNYVDNQILNNIDDNITLISYNRNYILNITNDFNIE